MCLLGQKSKLSIGASLHPDYHQFKITSYPQLSRRHVTLAGLGLLPIQVSMFVDPKTGQILAMVGSRDYFD
ncbi:MAG: hypothetical protein PHS67_07995, partial [Sphaerochaetaceae bacterium]|nr:hypothetical protein [Sphaerochaetaceae bacterium]